MNLSKCSSDNIFLSLHLFPLRPSASYLVALLMQPVSLTYCNFNTKLKSKLGYSAIYIPKLYIQSAGMIMSHRVFLPFLHQNLVLPVQSSKPKCLWLTTPPPLKTVRMKLCCDALVCEYKSLNLICNNSKNRRVYFPPIHFVDAQQFGKLCVSFCM